MADEPQRWAPTSSSGPASSSGPSSSNTGRSSPALQSLQPTWAETRDAFGFSFVNLSSEDKAARQACQTRAVARVADWKTVAEGGPMPADKKLKELCRLGIPHDLRAKVWYQVSGAAQEKAAAGPGYYMKLLGQPSTPEEEEWAHQIELARCPHLSAQQKDLPRTFPDHPWLKSEQGLSALRKVLTAYARRNPRVGYCQSLNYVAGYILLLYRSDDEHAFWLFATLVDNILLEDSYSRTLKGLRVEQKALTHFVGQKLPSLAKHFEGLHCDMSLLATEWVLCVFTTSLPPETAARVWDALLHEGAKVIYRVALALLKIVESQILATDNLGEVIQILQKSARGMHDRDKLMDVAFNGLGTMSHRVVDLYRMMGKMELKKEVKQQEARRKKNNP